MQFCIISPTAGLERYATRSKTHMVLAHQYNKDEAYKRFYLKRRALDDFILLDNGVYEGAYDEKGYCEALHSLNPDVAVLPDVLCKSQESTKLSLDFMKRHAGEFPATRWMFIPQGETLSNWRASLRHLLNFDKIDDVWLGLTRFLPTHVCSEDPLIRVKLATEIRSDLPWLPIHCMGMADGDVNELEVLARQGVVRSIDSSAPVWRGWQGIDIRAREDWRKNGSEVDFAASLDRSKSMIEQNLEVVLERCGVQSGPGDFKAAG